MIKICGAVVMIFAAVAMLASVAETIGTNPVVICGNDASVVKDGDLYKCNDGRGNLTAPHFGLSVWAPLVEPVRGECATGYEQACDARDHGARPYQAFGGGR